MKCPLCKSDLERSEKIIKLKQIKVIINKCTNCSYMTTQDVPNDNT